MRQEAMPMSLPTRCPYRWATRVTLRVDPTISPVSHPPYDSHVSVLMLIELKQRRRRVLESAHAVPLA